MGQVAFHDSPILLMACQCAEGTECALPLRSFGINIGNVQNLNGGRNFEWKQNRFRRNVCSF